MKKNKKATGYRQTIEIPKSIRLTGKVLQSLSPALATRYAARLFISPFRYPLPGREQHMDERSRQHKHTVSGIGKEIVVYEYGESVHRVLLVHGWSGRGTQLVKIADALLEAGYATVSFDAPAHGKAPGKTSDMSEFIDAAMMLEKEYGPFKAAIGHSLGGMTLLNAVKKGMQLEKLVTIGAGDMVEDIAVDFVRMLQLRDDIGIHIKKDFDRRIGFDINQLSASIAAPEVDIPTLVIHDEDDLDVPVSAARNIAAHLPDGRLTITSGLGHRKILGDPGVIEKIITFINN
ncbi:alpha/beta fold hydrolase [Sinomicrobium soli]|uniref:alpha/beta fold hydrolase n=1 Tax=Sinomicrobium sp. N-1-3-6 TaxID=2219864 RepID=UPI000DCB7C80|nr:alpha/beta hydrolase [Sinomicrobium sp. N-1-3-6]RAV30385.1 alpha/beta hydrolase [Sinomicrobium sp. N-1-3-6]